MSKTAPYKTNKQTHLIYRQTDRHTCTKTIDIHSHTSAIMSTCMCVTRQANLHAQTPSNQQHTDTNKSTHTIIAPSHITHTRMPSRTRSETNNHSVTFHESVLLNIGSQLIKDTRTCMFDVASKKPRVTFEWAMHPSRKANTRQSHCMMKHVNMIPKMLM